MISPLHHEHVLDEGITWSGTLRPYQADTLDRLGARWAAGRERAWVVLPPGSGKTLVGLEAARRTGRTTVVFAPNTAIQGQWLAHWRDFGGSPGTSRELTEQVTVLTYQSLAVFDPDAETDEEGRTGGLVDRLHPNGLDLIAALRDAGPLTLLLDECHHLLDVWGRLLAEILDDLPGARVIGLTATPPGSLTAGEAELVDRLFGEPIVGASVPAMVRQGYLAPFAELAWLTTPTAVEADYIAAEATRFTELVTDLLAPDFAPTGFLEWLDTRLAEPAAEEARVPWEWVERNEPELAQAALRLHHAGLLALPAGARMREQHRQAPTAEDWVTLLNDYVKHCLLPAPGQAEADAVAAIRRALPAVGHRLTRNGIRAARSPVDRVLARSAAKTHGAVEIAAAEAASLGGHLRCLVLCDHERAAATLPAGLREVLDPQAGAARLMLERLVADPRTRDLHPMLVTGRTVAADEATARAFAAFAAAEDPAAPDLAVEPAEDGTALVTGSWTSRRWVPLVTAFFEAGRCRVLVGTRGLLGEGWDARRINCLVDLTTATTPTAVVQTRGRALRLDPDRPGKTANTWTVVCATEDHPKGAADWERFVRKHEGYPAAAPDGEVVTGVAHVDASLSPYAPPEAGSFDALNARMLHRSRERGATRAAWRIGGGYRDETVYTLRVHLPRPPAPARAGPPEKGKHPIPPAHVPSPHGAAPPFRAAPSGAEAVPFSVLLARLPAHRATAPALTASALIAGGYAGFGLLGGAWFHWVWPIPGLLLLLGPWLLLRGERTREHAAAALDEAAGDPPLTHLACALADALAECGLSPRGAEAVTVRPEPDGSHRLSLSGVDTAVSERFAAALDELLSPPAAPRYVIPRYIVRPRSGRERLEYAQAWRRGRARADAVVYHAVPAVLGQNRGRARSLEKAWHRWVSHGTAVYTASAEGTGILAAHRGEPPLAATTAMRVAWE